MAWYRLKELDAYSGTYSDTTLSTKLYQGAPEEYDVTFDGYKFATTNADTNSHYVVKRNVPNPPSLGDVTAVRASATDYPENYKNKEIWIQTTNTAKTPLLASMVYDRVTDGTTEATLKQVLTANERPALYKGKSVNTRLFVRVPSAEMAGLKLNDFVGQIGYLENIYIRRNIGSEVFTDHRDTFDVTIDSTEAVQNFQILETNNLPTTLYDIASLTPVFSSTNATPQIQGTYSFQKSEYQKFFGTQYLTAELVETEVSELSFAVLPFEIKSLIDEGSTVLIEAEVFPDELKLYANADNGFLVFSDFSFTRKTRDSYDGTYYHEDALNQAEWQRLEPDINPWMDEIFTAGRSLVPATLYTCSCPSYAHAQLRVPESTQGEFDRAVNRQQRYPLPTAKGRTSAEQQGLSKSAGRIQSWESDQQKLAFKMCKHTVAAMFIERLKVKEPDAIPSYESRLKFEEKLKKEIAQVGEEFTQSYERGELSLLELVFATAVGLNMDEVELASAMLNTKF